VFALNSSESSIAYEMGTTGRSNCWLPDLELVSHYSSLGLGTMVVTRF
jgi:hypothetical protein